MVDQTKKQPVDSLPLKWQVSLPTTPDRFSSWLQFTTSSVRSQEFPTERGWCTLQPARVHRTLSGGGVLLHMNGAYHYLSKDRESPQESVAIWRQGYYLTFQVLAISSDRVHVTAMCYQPVLRGYFSTIREAIEKTWLIEVTPTDIESTGPSITSASRPISRRRSASGPKTILLPYELLQKAYWDLHDYHYQHPSHQMICDRLEEILSRHISKRTLTRRIKEHAEKGQPWPPTRPID